MPVMTRPGTLVLVTRPKGSSDALLADLEALGADVLEAPVQEIVPIGDLVDLPANTSALFTSRHAVGRVGSAKGRAAYCVGDATAEAARTAGFSAVSASGDAEDLLALLIRERPGGAFAYLRGRHVSQDLEKDLRDQGFNVSSQVVYDQREIALSAEALASAQGADRLILPLFSARSARLLAQQLPDRIVPIVVAISAKTADAWGRATRKRLIAEAPTALAVLDLTLRALDSDSPS